LRSCGDEIRINSVGKNCSHNVCIQKGHWLFRVGSREPSPLAATSGAAFPPNSSSFDRWQPGSRLQAERRGRRQWRSLTGLYKVLSSFLPWRETSCLPSSHSHFWFFTSWPEHWCNVHCPASRSIKRRQSFHTATGGTQLRPARWNQY